MVNRKGARVRLAVWRKKAGKTQADLAAALGCSQSYISQIERADNPLVPGPAIIIEIYRISDGAVMPNDYYDLPDLTAQRRAA
jgi:transcriptional regulator with XRE-family HTH domain